LNMRDCSIRLADVVAARERNGEIKQAMMNRVLMLGNNLLNAHAAPFFYADSI
jgi:hypothetical protein